MHVDRIPWPNVVFTKLLSIKLLIILIAPGLKNAHG